MKLKKWFLAIAAFAVMAVVKDLDRYDFTESETNDTKIKPLYEPRGMKKWQQIPEWL